MKHTLAKFIELPVKIKSKVNIYCSEYVLGHPVYHRKKSKRKIFYTKKQARIEFNIKYASGDANLPIELTAFL